MNTKTMEGLVGARTNMNLINAPMRVFKEAQRKGDTATMERAMGYVGEFTGKAEEYKAEAGKGMEEDAREAREKAKLQQEEAIQKRREEHGKLEKKVEEDRRANADAKEARAFLLEISNEGTALLKDNIGSGSVGFDKIKIDAIKKPVAYTKTGKAVPSEQGASISVSA